MTPEQIDRVFGRGRLKMVTGEHVEVFREAVAPGERRRYTKRFLNTREGDFGQWTEREWRILARLIGHGIACVPDVVQFDRGRLGGTQLVQTYDAGVTVDQWATLLPVTRDGCVHRHVFEDCAHWWALAHHCLLALNVIHQLELVHLDIKGDNVCIPYAPASFDPHSSELRLRPLFAQLALIDFAFALVSRESLSTPLPLGWQKEYDYQSPRLLAALEAGRNGELQLTRELDWRCDMYSLAAMLKRHLPDESLVLQPARAAGWTIERYDAAKAFILRIRDCHDSELPARQPHAPLLEQSGARLSEPELALSLERGWTLAREASVSAASASPLTPVTRLAPVMLVAPPVHVTRSGRTTAVTVLADTDYSQTAAQHAVPAAPRAAQPRGTRRARGPVAAAALIAICAVAATLWYLGEGARPMKTEMQALAEPIRAAAYQASDALHRLVRRDEEAQGGDVVAGQASAPAPPTATSEDMPAQGRRAAQAEFNEPIPPAPTAVAGAARSEPPGASTSLPPQPAAAVVSSTANAADAPPAPPSQAPREGSPAALPQQRVVQASESAPAVRKKSPTPAPAKQASTPSRASTNFARARSAKAPTAWHVAQSSSTQARRARASWASLEPPGWLRGGPGPGAPPGAKTHEPHAALVASSTEAMSAESPPMAATAPRSELAQPNLQPVQVVAAAPPADPPRAQAAASTIPARPPDVTSTASDGRRAPLAVAKEPSRGSLAAAPVEDRSEALKFALAQAPTAPEPRVGAADQNVQEDLAAQGRRTLSDTVPRVARQAELEVARVLSIAASAYQPMQDRVVADAARLTRIPNDAAMLARATDPGEARRLTDQARAAFASRRSVVEAFDLQLRAFGANPRDPDIAGYLAFLLLKLTPPQPEMARQIALVALAARGSQQHATRLEDWNTFAVASALSGREVDARNALFVTLSVSGNVERTCLSALNALANYGERLRRPVEAVLYRIRAQGRGYESPACASPPNWGALSRLP